jgi:hypothetical protein
MASEFGPHDILHLRSEEEKFTVWAQCEEPQFIRSCHSDKGVYIEAPSQEPLGVEIYCPVAKAYVKVVGNICYGPVKGGFCSFNW